MMLRWSWIFSSVAVFVMRLFCHIRLWSTRCWAVIWKCGNPHCASQLIQRERRLAEVSTRHPRRKKLVPRLAPTTTSTAEISTVRTDIPVQHIAVIPRQPRSHSIMNKAMVRHHVPEATRSLIEQDDDYAKLIKCEIERFQVENRKFKLESSILEGWRG